MLGYVMAIPAALAILPLGLLFILSGLVVNLIQVAFYILVRPMSKNLYRRINKVVVELLWLELIWLIDWWAGVKVEVFAADSETFELMGKEHSLVICNHRSDIDWLVGWVLAQRSNCLGSTLAVMKKSLKFLPIIGWSMWFSDYVFVERSWAKDERTLKWGLERLEDFPRPFWLALFVEGTRFTHTKLSAARQYAISSDLPIPSNVLIPRTKGFVAAVTHIRSFVPAVYDITVAVPRDQPSPTMLRILSGQSSVVNLYIKRHTIQELPVTDAGIAQWCKDTFVAKVVITWSCLLLLGLVKFFQWSLLLSSWEGITSLLAFLVFITVIMHILIIFSQSERSDHVMVRSSDRLKENLLPK
ncbi:1-acyl-sn-glycerol-3-phosphate acyltransferase PLS1 isoform X2 [Vitis vinifera]|uniref:1-acylglycerol-3-phosphate O-acyltransferase n=1 Tax=Vitis vinifera TaxID=29760 RepID=A0A438KIX1_VITVI|nr:1-acyl-sn-glycerol-3-phosphate acyltransferase PLS1 isoform X2 [Vitis vinifera]RVX21120.1 1-acyl-sn-glycerol-3-phosphate acyltransferase 2 [Vitis vinifera]|eukprot:XP_019076490.1 PREDICTED: 1-acyl-sn-glycerol-3-phosphate acyltransferase PLS1 isoform X2 [Vitis vinifera]